MTFTQLVSQIYDNIAAILLVILILIFAAIGTWAYWPTHKRRFEKDAQIPLRDDE